MTMDCELSPIEQEWALAPEDMPEGCRSCRHRGNLYWLLGVPFCGHSHYTRAKTVEPCDEYKREQLTLFDL